MKKFIVVHHLFLYDLENMSKSLYHILTLTAQSYIVTLEWQKRPDGRDLYEVTHDDRSKAYIGSLS